MRSLMFNECLLATEYLEAVFVLAYELNVVIKDSRLLVCSILQTFLCLENLVEAWV